jgi:predicted ATP-grasp superfamily ATP-dependent carboligase
MAKKSEAVVLVTDASKGCALAVIRSLGRAGYRVVAADTDPSSPGLRSRYVARTEVYPDPATDPAAFCESILAMVRRHGVDLVIPATDWTVQPLAVARRDFEGITRLAIADSKPLEIARRKQETVKLAERVGVPVPATRVAHSVDEALAAAPELGWPLVLKPQSSHGADGAGIVRHQVEYAQDADDLAERIARLTKSCPVLLQRYLAGRGHGVELLACGGRLLAAFEHRRLREVPITGGASSYRESVPLDPTRLDYARRLIEALDWTGLAMVEFKVAEGRSELMEINGRVWGSLPLAVASGVDFPAMLARLYLEGESAVPSRMNEPYRLGLRCRNLDFDLLWIAQTLAQRTHHPFLATPRRAEAWPALFGMLSPRNKMDIQCLEDPLPGLLDLGRIGRKLWRKLLEARVHEVHAPLPQGPR